jgi:hypothetical protein
MASECLIGYGLAVDMVGGEVRTVASEGQLGSNAILTGIAVVVLLMFSLRQKFRRSSVGVATSRVRPGSPAPAMGPGTADGGTSPLTRIVFAAATP